MKPTKYADIPTIIGFWKSSEESLHWENYTQISGMYDISTDSGLLSLSTPVEDKMLKTFDSKDKAILQNVVKQDLIFVHNVFTNEGTVYNPLRSKRPGIATDTIDEKKIVDELSEETGKACDFCNYERCTATDVFGRLETEHSFTIANSFKYDAWHSMVLLRSHHPLDWSREELVDMFELGMTWFKKMQGSVARENIYPMILWDTLPRAGGSQVHQHIHVSLSKRRYLGQLEAWRQAAINYHLKYPDKCYFQDLIRIHLNLGLAVEYCDVVAIAHITPRKDNEIVVVARQPSSNFYTMIYFVSRVFIDILGQSSFSVAIAYPPMVEDEKNQMWAFSRMAPRGSLNSMRSDISSLELFAGPTISEDPYKVIAQLRRYIQQFQTAESRLNGEPKN